MDRWLQTVGVVLICLGGALMVTGLDLGVVGLPRWITVEYGAATVVLAWMLLAAAVIPGSRRLPGFGAEEFRRDSISRLWQVSPLACVCIAGFAPVAAVTYAINEVLELGFDYDVLLAGWQLVVAGCWLLWVHPAMVGRASTAKSQQPTANSQ